MDKNIFEEGPRRGHAAGDTSIEQQASQLASDIKYKARQKMKGKSGSNMSPGQVQQLYRSLLSSSPAPGAVKSIVKKKLFGEQVDPGITPVSEHVKDSASSVFTKVFLEGADQKFIVRVTDKVTGNTSYRKADRAKIAELRANKNISSVEITGRKKADDAYDSGKGGKKAKKDYDGDGKVESGSKEHAGAVHNAIQRKKGGVADGQDTRKEEYVDEGLRSAVKRLLGKKDAPAEKKPESRGEQLRKKYNVGPERSDTSAKRQILNRTRAKAERDKKQYGGSVYTKKVADKSKAAHDRYLKAGYSKYGAGDARGKGNKARRRAEALKKEDFNWLVDTLISEGYNLSSYTVDQFYDFCEEVIYEKEENGEKKLDVMKGKNTVKVNPTIGESIRAELDALKSQRVAEAAAIADEMKKKEKSGLTPEQRKQLQAKDQMLKKKIMLQKQQMQMQKQGRLPLNYSEEAGSVRYCPKCDKDETRDECKYGGEYWDENSKPAKAEDPRSIPTAMNLTKNKLRAMGLKMSYDMNGEMTESAEDRLRDFRQERGGLDGNKRYDRPPARKSTNKELGIRDFTPAEKEKRAKEITAHLKKMRR
jgi:hypothetical protein